MPSTADQHMGRTLLADRGIVAVTGRDAAKLLQDILTNDLTPLATGAAVFAALLTPQGKILADLIAVAVPEGILLDVSRTAAGNLVKRLGMYKLRASVEISDVSDCNRVFATWGGEAEPSDEARAIASFADPRGAGLGTRTILSVDAASAQHLDANVQGGAGLYEARRIALGISEAGSDYEFADAYPHEANLDVMHGLSFTKGCYVGQEIVARMQNKTVVRRRIVKVEGSTDLARGDEIVLGDVPIGKIGTARNRHALAMLRLDRAIEAREKGIALRAGQSVVTPDPRLLESYAALAAKRAASMTKP